MITPESKLGFGNKESVLNNCVTDTKVGNIQIQHLLHKPNIPFLILPTTFLQVGFCKVWTGMLAWGWGFVVIACATMDAVAEATCDIGHVIACVCDSGLEEGIQFLLLLQLFVLAFKE